MLTGAFLYLPLVSMPEADSLKHPQSFYLTKISPQTVFVQHSKYPTKPMEFANMKSVRKAIHKNNEFCKAIVSLSNISYLITLQYNNS